MEHVLTTEYIRELVLDHLTIKELNNIRCCSKELQIVISEYSEQKMVLYMNIINRKITKLCQDNMSSLYEMPYIVIYNYYHIIIRYSYLILEHLTHTEFQKLMRCLHDKKVEHRGHKYIFDTDRYKKSDIGKHSYSLFDIMTCIYLCNTGNEWSSYHCPKEHLPQLKFLQGKLLPLS